MKKRFVVLDGSSLIFRAFYALPPMTSAQGQPTGAILGFSNMLTRLLSDLKPDLMALAFDKSRHTFRTERYADYKGTRDKTPEELISQIPLLKELAQALGIPSVPITASRSSKRIVTRRMISSEHLRRRQRHRDSMFLSLRATAMRCSSYAQIFVSC